MNILIVTNLFPNSLNPTFGNFVFQETKALSKIHNISVIAPIPYLPRIFNLFSRWSKYADIPFEEKIEGITVSHPKYFVTPRIGRRFYGFFFRKGIQTLFKKLIKKNNIDIVLTHYAYPDGYAVQRLIKKYNIPHIIKVRGSDINVWIQNKVRKKLTLNGLLNASKVITVSDALKVKAIQLGVPEEKILTIQNGVDINIFKKIEKSKAKEMLNWIPNNKYLLFIGNLVSVKGIPYLLEAFRELQLKRNNINLVIVGDGELLQSIKSFINENNLEEKIILAGRQPHSEIVKYLCACDVLCLPSLNEGCPNVIVEGMSVNAKIVASRVGGIPELLENYPNAQMVEPGNSQSLSFALEKQLSKEIIINNNHFRSWDDVSKETTLVFSNLTNKQMG